jgi:hypothetical protein
MTIFAVMCAGIFPMHSRRSYLVCLVVVPIAKREWSDLASVQVTSPVGRVCSINLFHGIILVLVYGTDS